MGSDDGERPVARAEVPYGRGVQVGDYGVQVNVFGPVNPPPAPVVVGDVPQEPLAFQPRAGLLASLEPAGPGARVTVVRALTGMRGVGKTQLAAALARDKIAAGWRLVAWVNAEEPAGLLAGLTEAAGALGLAAADGPTAGRAVRHWLEADGRRCLLVFDNATDPVALRPFIPAAGAARVVITSNEQSMRYLGAGVTVEVFSPEEALAFLTEQTGLDDPAGAGRVAAELGYLPLALAQAAAVIAEQRLDYATYLGRLRGRPAGELLRAEGAGQYPRGVAAAVLLSLDGVRTRDSTGVGAAVMELLAVLSPDGVRRTTIEAAGRLGVVSGGQENEVGADTVDGALGRLAGASLLTFSVDRSVVSAHRLTMRVIREHLAARGALTEVCAGAARLLDELAESVGRPWREDRAAARDLVEQVTALYGTSAACPASAGLAAALVRLRWWAVWFLGTLGDGASQTIEIAEPLLAELERVLGTDHPDTLTSRNNLASAYQDAGRVTEAISLHERNLADRERVLGAAYPDTLTTRYNLGAAYRLAGRVGEAISLHQRNLTDQERVLGTDDLETLRTRYDLGAAYRLAGRVGEAISLHRQNLTDQERVLGTDDPDTLATRYDLAEAYQDAGRVTEAIALHQQNLADQERVLGTDHPDAVKSRDSLANARRAAGGGGAASLGS